MAMRLVVNGAAGRMGRMVVAGAVQDPRFEVVGALEESGNPDHATDAGIAAGVGSIGIAISSELPVDFDGVIDFSAPAASLSLARKLADRGTPMLVATTGFEPEQRKELEALGSTIPLLIASNCSLVVNVLMMLVRKAGAALRDKDFDVEIVERHHRFKVDSPSGTALRFAEILEQEMGLTTRRYGREGIVGERPRDELGLHAIRVGDNVGEHAILFSTLGETMELVHKGHGRESYVRGALAAMLFLKDKPPGLYDMADVLGLEA